MKLFKNIYLSLIIFLISISIFSYALYKYFTSPISTTKEENTIVIAPGSIDSIGKFLESEGYIRSKDFFKLYIKITGQSNLKAGTYTLSKSMSLIEIIDILESGKSSVNTDIKILFKEGLNLRQIAKGIAENTNNTENDVFNTLSNQEYLDSLISKYWFLTDIIKDNRIYYSLEGYLYPSTYYFKDKDVEVTTIFNTMLEETNKKLEPYKDKLTNNKYNIHELLTLASITELEALNKEDRKGVASVWYNRLNNNMNLGSDVTTYYGAKINISDLDDDLLDLNKCNNYNTRCQTFKTLPIGPICNPSIDSILAVLEPESTKYLYFLADKNGKIYFAKTYNEHINNKNKLIKENLWY